MSLDDEHQPSPADLYAEWKAFDLARETRWEKTMMEIPIVEAPAEAETITAVEPPAEPVGGREACPCCQGSGLVPRGLHESPRTGRRYAQRVTANGTRYGLEHGGRFVMVTAVGHTIERARGGCPSLDRFVDHLAESLRVRAEAIEAAKAEMTNAGQREVLDALLQRWFRYPVDWKPTRKRIVDTIQGLKLSANRTHAASSRLNRKDFRATFNE